MPFPYLQIFRRKRVEAKYRSENAQSVVDFGQLLLNTGVTAERVKKKSRTLFNFHTFTLFNYK